MTVHPIRPTTQRPARRVDLHAIDAEQAVLGAAMLTPTALAWLLRHLDQYDFYRPAHRTVYAAIAKLARHAAPVDPVSVATALSRSGQLADIGGAPYLHTLVAAVPTPANAAYYGRMVAELASLRRLRDIAIRLTALVEEPHMHPKRAIRIAHHWLDEAAAPTDAPPGDGPGMPGPSAASDRSGAGPPQP